MNRKSMLTIGTAAVWLAVLGGLAISAQDKYTLKVPGGLAFSEFRGYEGWQAISMSRNERVVAMILGDPVMIDAYRAGIPGSGKPVPDRAKMAKIHWTPKPNEFFPEATVPGSLLNVDFMVKDSKRSLGASIWVNSNLVWYQQRPELLYALAQVGGVHESLLYRGRRTPEGASDPRPRDRSTPLSNRSTVIGLLKSRRAEYCLKARNEVALPLRPRTGSTRRSDYLRARLRYV